MSGTRPLLCALAAAGTLLSVSAAAAETAPPPGKTLGFAVTSMPFALPRGEGVCPEGFAIAAKDIYLRSVSKAEQLRLLRPENLEEFEKKAYHTPDGRDLCTAPDFKRAPMITMQGKTGFGMDLDGSNGEATESTCAHDKLTTPAGTKADNQVSRLLGCLSNYYGFSDGELGYLESLRNQAYKDGGTTMLIDVSGVDDPRNDPDVTIGFYTGSDPMAIDVAGRFVPYASLSVTDETEMRATGKGKIVDGVLIGEPVEIRLRYDLGGGKKVYHVHSGRLRLDIGSAAKDGSVKGMMAGYLSEEDVGINTSKGKQSGTEMIGIDCPSFHQAFQRLADGGKDPATGACTTISTAWDVHVIPAFVIHPEETQKSAAASPAPQAAEVKR